MILQVYRRFAKEGTCGGLTVQLTAQAHGTGSQHRLTAQTHRTVAASSAEKIRASTSAELTPHGGSGCAPQRCTCDPREPVTQATQRA
eukprot:15673702-Heterocapsa_arctica.AAC.1